MPPKKKSPPGIRIQLKGNRTTAELRAMLHEAIDKLEAHGVTHIKGPTNLYVNAADENGERVTPFIAPRKKLKEILIKEPYRSAADEHGL